MEQNINVSLDDAQMELRGLPKIGNKRKKVLQTVDSAGRENRSEYSEITDNDLVRSDFEEYRGLGMPSIDSYTMNSKEIADEPNDD